MSFRPVKVLPGEFVFLECQQSPLRIYENFKGSFVDTPKRQDPG